MSENKIPREEIEKFINGDDPQERIVNLDYKYKDDFISVYYRNEKDEKCVERQPFYPFAWATRKACLSLCNGDRQEVKSLLTKYGITVEKLSNTSIDGIVRPEFENGYMFMFRARKPMSYQNFLSFFKKAGYPIYPDRKKKTNEGEETKRESNNDYIVVTPQEQFLISTGKRFFKGYSDYDQLLRMTFDLESTGLDTEKDRIVQLGVRLNRPIPSRPNGFEKIFNLEGETEEEKNKSELKIIDVFFRIIYTFRPDIITAHNGENFDWKLIIGACKRLGTSIEEMSSKYFQGESIRKQERETILKLGGEIETFHETVVPGTIVTDSLHAVRRAQAIDSNMQQADLKYATKYAELGKNNRVYTPGNKISEIFDDLEEHYAFNNEDGDWYIYDKNSTNNIKHKSDFETEKEYNDYVKSLKGKQGDKPFVMRTRNEIMDGYELVSGRYIIIRYLLDDIWECDRVEWKFNSTNFLICKMLPIPYKKCTTMGTAGQWKALMMAWSYKNKLAIPPLVDTGKFTGGLSRLLKTGYSPKIVKLDWNSLYVAILLTWGIKDTNDLMNSALSFLEYVLTTREKYKKQKKNAEKKIDSLKGKIKDNTATKEEIEEYKKAEADFALADGKQAQMKVLGNSFFGSFGSNRGSAYPWKSVRCAEQTTCIGRQSLRLIIGYFSTISQRYNLNDEDYNYSAIVGDSVAGDTPLFIRYKDSGLIDIKPISELIDEKYVTTDQLKRQYDYSDKPYQVLCRTGWSDIEYVYRHKIGKKLCRVGSEEGIVDVTEGHSLFDKDKNEIKPTEIKEDTVLEKYNGPILPSHNTNPSYELVMDTVHGILDKKIDRLPMELLNANQEIVEFFVRVMKLVGFYPDDKQYPKTVLAGYKYLRNKVA